MASDETQQLTMKLLGPVSIELNGKPATGLPSRKAEALFIYLACHKQPFPREFLAELLWDDRPQAQALANLRSILSSLRRTLGPFLTITRQTVAFNHTSDVWLDLDVLTDALDACQSHSHLAPESCEICMQRLERAVNLYHGPFLQGYSVADSSGFEEWSLLMHERTQRRVLDALQQLANFHTRRGQYAQARRYARRQVEWEPYREEAHRQLMVTLVRTGQRTAALTQYEYCRRILNEELGVEPSADTRALYQRIRSAGQSDVHNLPPQLTPLIGRETELQQIATHLANPDCHLLTLSGPGGVGKTLLALQAAREHIGIYLHGVYFVPLASVNELDRLYVSIADAVHCPQDGAGAVQDQLFDFLREKEILLVLDNFEHLLAGSHRIFQLMQAAPYITLLITSRERLHVRGEYLLQLRGLSFPAKTRAVSASPETYSAVQLFVTAARRVNPGFAPSPGEMTYVLDICRHLEGLPLAIELAAAWTRLVGTAETLREIQHDLGFLTSTRRDAPGGQQSMRLVFRRSWRLLREDEQEALSRLSVFRGSFDAQDARQVANADLHMLLSLIDKSLLRRTAGGRFDLHELLKQYLAEKLAQRPAMEQAARNAHCRRFGEFLHEREEMLRDARQTQAMMEIAQAIEDIRAAWQWAIEHHLFAVLDQAAESAYLFFWARNRFAEGKEFFAQAINGLAAADLDGGTAILKARLQVCMAEMMYWLGEYHAVEAALEESLTAFRHHQAKRELVLALELLGRLFVAQGAYSSARQYYEESLRIARQIGAKREFAQALSSLASTICMETADYVVARPMYAESMDVYQEIGDQYGIAKVIVNLGVIEHEEGNYPAAQAFYEQSLQIYRTLEYRYGIAAALTYLGELAQITDDAAAAKRLLAESLALSRESGNRNAIVESLVGLGHAHIRLGALGEARQCLAEALDMGLEIQAPQLSLNGLKEYARLFFEVGQAEQAVTILRSVLDYPLEAEELKSQVRRLLQEFAPDGIPVDATGHPQPVAVSLRTIVEMALNTPLHSSIP